MADGEDLNGSAADSNEVNLNEEEFTEMFKPQFIASGVPQHLWKTVYHKITDDSYDIGDYVMEVQEECEDDTTDSSIVVHKEDGIKADSAFSVFLVDHAYTFELKHARQHLSAMPNLLQRMCDLMDIRLGQDPAKSIDEVMSNMWRYVQTYKIRTPEMQQAESLSLWYITDEVGCRIRHSDTPNCKMVPFTTLSCTYSLLWPLRDIAKDERLTVDRVYALNCSDPLFRQARSLPWVDSDLTHVPFAQTEPTAEYFEKYRHGETLPEPNMQYQPLPKDRKLRVCMSYQNFMEFLTDDRFTVVDSPEGADIVWIAQTFKDFEELSINHPGRHISQFPCEMVLTVKDLVAVTARRCEKTTSDPLNLSGPEWLPVTFNLETELPQFVSYFQTRQKEGLDNTWICKPWNQARGMNITISQDLDCLVRLPETGPLVACKYIEDPVLFYREEIGKVKFDIRYIVLLRSAQPLKVYAYKVFWLRFANVAFSMDNFHEYEKHFTVMNYVPTELKQVHYDEFIPMFEQQYPDFSWSTVEGSIFTMLRELFEAAVSKPPPQGLGHSPQSRAFYAVDLMLKWGKSATGESRMVPQLCEVNFAPDCERACKYHPFFVNDVFSTLFLDETEGKHVELIS